MNKLHAVFAACVLASSAWFSTVQAAWGDVSYNPNPEREDDNIAAEYDSVGILAALVLATGLTRGVQDFEQGFSDNSLLDDWVAIGNNRVRFGFGADLAQIEWRSRIGRIDPYSSQYGLSHPHGTYGNVAGVLNAPRNCVADHYFLTSDTPGGAAVPRYFAIQFESPISFLSLTMIDYANGVGGVSHMDVLSGRDVLTANLVASLPDQHVPVGRMDGAFDYWFGRAPSSQWEPRSRPDFNIAVLRLDTPDSSVGFDNLIIGGRDAPEPAAWSLLAAGLGLLSFSRAKGRRG